jgi:hypothetical protein
MTGGSGPPGTSVKLNDPAILVEETLDTVIEPLLP